MYHREFGDGGGWGDGGAATVGVVGAAHRELGGEQHHGEHRAAPGQLRTKIFLAMKLIRWSEHWLYGRQTNWGIFDLFTNLESLFVKLGMKEPYIKDMWYFANFWKLNDFYLFEIGIPYPRH